VKGARGRGENAQPSSSIPWAERSPGTRDRSLRGQLVRRGSPFEAWLRLRCHSCILRRYAPAASSPRWEMYGRLHARVTDRAPAIRDVKTSREESSRSAREMPTRKRHDRPRGELGGVRMRHGELRGFGRAIESAARPRVHSCASESVNDLAIDDATRWCSGTCEP
jgi:hypothetical protein